jgi:hypothetical protein
VRPSYAADETRDMSLRARLLAPLLLVPLLAVPQQAADAAPAAQAGTQHRARQCANGRPQKVIADPSGDSARGIDISAAGLWHKSTDRCLWTTVSGRFGAQYAQAIQVLYDTDPGQAGAEYYAFAYSPRDGDERRGASLVGRVDGEWRRLDCDVYSFFRPGRDQVGMGLPTTCLGSPARVRVKIQLWDIRDYLSGNRWRGVADQVPSRRWSPRF